MNAKDVPLSFGAKETHTGDMKIDQKKAIENREDLESEVVTAPADLSLDMEYQELLKFNEQPITVTIHSGGAMPGEKFPPKFVPVWCNGKGAEVFMNGRWVEVEALPVGIPVTVKRKYVEILVRSKHTSVNTRHEGTEAEQPRNLVERNTTAFIPISVNKDTDPRGGEWLRQLTFLNG